MYPQLIQVDPHRIKYNPANPRRHQGPAYARLQRSIKTVGMVQLPSVRVLSGGFYECIDGEGRVKAAQDTGLERIWVVSFGLLSDNEALLLLQAANVVREFSYLAECRGLAGLHQQGMSVSTLATKFGGQVAVIADMVAIGSFPEEICSLIQQDMERSEEHAQRWTPSLLTEVLPLRQERPGQVARHVERGQPLPFAILYDYEEVCHAVEQVIAGEITTGAQMHTYVTRRRLELYQQRFDQELQQRLEAELVLAKEALKEATQQQTAHVYQIQIEALQHQVADLEHRYQTVVRDVAKRPEVIAQREQELAERIAGVEEERLRLQDDMQRQLEAEQAQLEHQYAQTTADLEAYYAQRNRERELHTEVTVQQIIANAMHLLAEADLLVLNLLTPEVFKGVIRSREAELVGLIAQIRAVRETLEKAEEKLLHSGSVSSDDC